MSIESHKYLAFLMGNALHFCGKEALEKVRQDDPTLTLANSVFTRDYFSRYFGTSSLSSIRRLALGMFGDDPDLLNAFEVLCCAVCEGLTDGVLALASIRPERLGQTKSIHCVMLVKAGNTFAA